MNTHFINYVTKEVNLLHKEVPFLLLGIKHSLYDSVLERSGYVLSVLRYSWSISKCHPNMRVRSRQVYPVDLVH